MPWPTTSRHTRGYGTQHDKARKQLLATEPLCRACKAKGRIRSATIADHIIPLSKGGTGVMSNYQPLCKPCSDEKTLRDEGKRVKPTIGADGWPIT